MIFKEGCLRSHLIRITHENWLRRTPRAHGGREGAGFDSGDSPASN